MMEITKTDQENVTIIGVDGKVDLSNANSLGQSLQESLDENKLTVLVDLTSLEEIDSSGLGVLIGHAKNFKDKKGVLAIAGMSPTIHEVFKITRLINFFKVFDTPKEAITTLSKR